MYDILFRGNLIKKCFFFVHLRTALFICEAGEYLILIGQKMRINSGEQKNLHICLFPVSTFCNKVKLQHEK